MRAIHHGHIGLLLAGAVIVVGCGRTPEGATSSGIAPAQPAAPAGAPATDAAVIQKASEREQVDQQGGRLEVKLDFAGKAFTDADLAKLPLNDAVTEINLSGTQITDDGLAELKRAKNLTSVNLDDTKITDKGLEHLKELPALQWVELMGNPQISTEAYDGLQKVLASRRPGT